MTTTCIIVEDERIGESCAYQSIEEFKNDPFYSAKNQEALRCSIEQIETGQIVTKTLDELRRME